MTPQHAPATTVMPTSRPAACAAPSHAARAQQPPMLEGVGAQLASLATMTVAQLQARYAQVFGEPSRSGNRQWLLRRVAWRIQALAEGGLSERAVLRAQELARDSDARMGAPAPRRTHRGPLEGVRHATVRLQVGGAGDASTPAPGTVLVRVYRGVEHRVTVLPGGFEYQGATYRSLSAVAGAITGSHWNGRLFFGLARRSDACP